MLRAWCQFGIYLSLIMLSMSCIKTPCPPIGAVTPPPEASDIDSVLLIIGDAGAPDPTGEPVLQSLKSALLESIDAFGSDRTRVLFLGDNLYPKGLPAESDKKYDELRAKLDQQLDIFEPFNQKTEPYGLFLPGNHDWGSSDGWGQVKRQGQYINEKSAGKAAMLPRMGCPGPVVIDVGERLRVLAIDSHWWLRGGEKPENGIGGCENDTPEEITLAIQDAIEQAEERLVLVAAHHPLMSGGSHGTNRGLGLIHQDIPGKRYQRMIKSLTSAFSDHPKVIHAGGHEHSLQVIQGEGYAYQLVSGSGSQDNLTKVGGLPSTVFCRSASGYMRLIATKHGGVWLGVYEAGNDQPIYSQWLWYE